jgi:serine/threonine protein kinase
MDIIINKKYKLLSKIGQGQFGQVYCGKIMKTSETVAIKIEILDTSFNNLKHETALLHYLRSKGVVHVPSVYWYGLYMLKPVLIMTMYEKSLDEYLRTRELSVKDAANLAIQMVEILDNIHTHYVIHRDLKPQNFMWKNDELYLIDFGLSTVYVDAEQKHILSKNDGSTIIGTPKFVSIHIHEGLTASRRDDLISIIYIYMYMLGNQHIPWENVPEQTPINNSYAANHILHYKNQLRKQLKIETTLEAVDSLGHILNYVYDLKYAEPPNYSKVTEMLGI